MASKFRPFKSFCVLLAALALSGCSPASLFGGSEDKQVEDQNSYRHVNPECAKIKIVDHELDAPTFYKLVDCFNNDGGLKEISDLVHKLSPEELDSILKVTNNYILYDAKTLHEIDASFKTMSDNKAFDESLAQLGSLLENEDFLEAMLGLLKDLYFKRGGLLAKPAVDTDLLKAIEYFSTKMNGEKFIEGVDTGITLASSKAFGSLQVKLRGDSRGGRTLESLIDQALTFANTPTPSGAQPLGRRLLDKTVSGELLKALDPVIGMNETEIASDVPRTTSVLDVVLANNGHILDGIYGLFRGIDREIFCMKGTQSIPNGVNWVINEIASRPSSAVSAYLGRENPLALGGASPFCEQPAALASEYPKFMELASRRAIEPTADLIRAFKDSGQVRFLVDLLEDPQFQMLTPILSELSDRGALQDIVLLAAMTRVEDRPSLYKALNTLVEPIPSLNGRALGDLLKDAMARVHPAYLYEFARTLGVYFKSDQPVLAPLLFSARKAYYTDSSHPYVGLITRFLGEASKNEAMLTSLFTISERDDFKDAIKLLAKISKNGRLKEMIGTAIAVFKPFAGSNEDPVEKTDEPAFVPFRRHNLASADLVPFNGFALTGQVPEACKGIDFSIALDAYGVAGYDRQLSNYLNCLNSNGAHALTVRTINFLSAARTEDGRSYWTYTLDLLKTFMGGLGRSEVNFLSDALVSAIDDQRIYRLLAAVPFVVSTNVHGTSDAVNVTGPVLRPLLDVAAPLVSGEPRKSLGRIERYGAKVLRRDDLIAVAGHAEDLWDQKPEPVTPVDPATYPVDKLKELIRTKECVTSAAAQKKRVDQIIYDYRNGANDWELVDGQPRTRWSKKEFKDAMEPLFERIADPSRSDPKKPLLHALLKVMNYFTLAPGERPDHNRHYTPAYLMTWLKEKSDDLQPILYFYPDEDAPRARVINSLDRLDLVLLNSDFEAPFIKNNFALQSLGYVAESWGDEPESAWPQEIIDKARRTGERPPTLEETVKKIEKLTNMVDFGNPVPKCPSSRNSVEDIHEEIRSGRSGIPLPGFTELKRELFNTKQVFQILYDNLPRDCTAAETKRGECTLNARGAYEKAGLKVLRDLFFELHYSTPVEYRWEDHFLGDPLACLGSAKKGACAGDNNNLNVLLKLVRMGLIRQAGRALKYQSVKDPSVQDFWEGLVNGATAPNVERFLKPLFPNDGKRTMLWTALDQIFDVMNASEGRDLSDFYAKQLVGKTEAEKTEIRAGWVKQYARVKQMTWYLVALADDFGIIGKAVDGLAAVMDKFKSYLEAQVGKLGEVLRVESPAYLVRAVYEDRDPLRADLADILRDAVSDPTRFTDAVVLVKAIGDSPKATKAFSLSADRWDIVSAMPGYQNLKMGEIGTDLKNFLLERSTAGSNATSHQLRLFLADRMESGELDQLLLLLGNHPDDAYGILEAVSQEASSGQFTQFLQLLRRGLAQQNWAWR